MKAIIYAGIGLFSVATVYGLTDYYSSKKSGELQKLYAEEKNPPPAPVEQEKTADIIPVKNMETATTGTRVVKTKAKSLKKTRKAKKTIRFENFSRGRIKEPAITEDKVTEKKS